MMLIFQLSVLVHLAIPWLPVALASRRSFTKFHPIKKNLHYRLWNPVSNGLIKKDPRDLTTVYCSGGFDSTDSNHTVVQAKQAGPGWFNLVFKGKQGEPDLYITAKEQGQELTLTQIPSDYARFEPIYYWSYTLFRSKRKSTSSLGMYLGSDDNNSMVTLVAADEVNDVAAHYPHPKALFIVNKVKTPVH